MGTPAAFLAWSPAAEYSLNGPGGPVSGKLARAALRAELMQPERTEQPSYQPSPRSRSALKHACSLP